MVGWVLALALSATSADVQVSPEPPRDRSWLGWTGLSSGVRGSGVSAGGQGWIGLSRTVAPHLRPEVDLGLGYFGGPQQVIGSMRLGLNVDGPAARVVPFGWVAFAHNHEMALHMAEQSPVGMLLGMSESGVDHRSGGEVGAGLNVHLGSGRDAGPDAIVGVRATALALLGSGPTLALGGVAYLGVAF